MRFIEIETDSQSYLSRATGTERPYSVSPKRVGGWAHVRFTPIPTG
jgi:hypothetical protein